jgi:hypothetical protein
MPLGRPSNQESVAWARDVNVWDTHSQHNKPGVSEDPYETDG